MTWNLLAHVFTIHHKSLHRTHWNLGREDPEQTRDRYRLATEVAMEQRPDVLLLQECDPAFLTVEMELNPRAHCLLDEYVAYCCFGADGEAPHKRQKPGCCILLHKAGRLARVPGVPVAVCDGDTAFGGQHYASVAVLCTTRSGRHVWIGTLHQRYEAPIHLPPVRGAPNQRGAQLNALRRAMAASSPCPNIIVAGDFNATCRSCDEEFVNMSLIEGCTWLGQETRRVRLASSSDPVEAPTGLNPDWSSPVAIDHVYATPDLAPVRFATQGIPQVPYRVYPNERMLSAIEVPSDHVWVKVHFRHQGPVQDGSVPLVPGDAGVLAFGNGGPPHGLRWDGYRPPPPEPSMRGRRVRMLVAKFGMPKGATGVVMGPSKSGKAWELDNGKCIMKDHKGHSWEFI